MFNRFKNKIKKKLSSAVASNENVITDNFKNFGSYSVFCGYNHKILNPGYLSIGDNVSIGENSYIDAAGEISIGDNTKIERNVVMFSASHDYMGNVLPYDIDLIKMPVTIGANVWIGMNVKILPGTQIGDGAIIKTGAVVSGQIPICAIVEAAPGIIVSYRDKKHYNHLSENKKFGGKSGMLISKGKVEGFLNVGDVYNGRRSTSEMIMFNGRPAVKKTYVDTSDGNKSHNTELKSLVNFQNYSWCPRVLEQGSNYVIIEYFPASMRLDNIENPGIEICEEILWVLLDVFNEGYIHRDFHAKNIFITENGIKIIDFETMSETDEKDFFASYDITGQGHESPYLTGNMCIFNDASTSIGKIFNLTDSNQLMNLLSNRFKKQMLDSSISFKTLRNSAGRHKLQTKNIYSSFNLKNIIVTPAESQRNTFKRFERFGINEAAIKGKSVLDIGSNIGATLCGLIQYNPAFMRGIEYDQDKVALSNKLAKYNQSENLLFSGGDLEDDNFRENFNDTFDVVFCLAVIEHLTKKKELLQFLSKVCKQILYFEGNANSDIDYIMQGLKTAGFSNVEYLGFSDDEKNPNNNVRPLFIAKK